MKKSVVGSLVVTTLLIAVAGLIAAWLVLIPTPAEAAPCRCPLIYAPVQCDNGRTYPNSCVADCHHADNCVPVNPGS